jgi:hypothetical protein
MMLSWNHIRPFGPLFLTLLVMVWTLVVSPYSKYGDNWAIYPPIALFLLAIIWHIYLVVTSFRWEFVLYAVLHIPVMFLILFRCMFLISKDSF